MRIERNLSMRNVRPSSPMRSCAKNIGPGDVSFTSTPISNSNGDSTTRAAARRQQSVTRLPTTPHPSSGESLIRTIGNPCEVLDLAAQRDEVIDSGDELDVDCFVLESIQDPVEFVVLRRWQGDDDLVGAHAARELGQIFVVTQNALAADESRRRPPA